MSSILVRTASHRFWPRARRDRDGLPFRLRLGMDPLSLGLAGLLVHHVVISPASPVGFTLAHRSCRRVSVPGGSVHAAVSPQRAETARSRQLAHLLARSRQPPGASLRRCDPGCGITASSGATIPVEAHFASTPKPTSGSRSPTSCASRNSSSTSRRKNSPSPAAENGARRPRPLRAVRSLRRLAAAAAFARHNPGTGSRPCAGTSSRTSRMSCAPRSPCWWVPGNRAELKLDPERSRDT